ncbi:putative uncharacterized protein [Clostridium sp. CAG:1193]|jgi:processive 1,2-diacylglycerol beta-glucosyltransferase|nr:putative uncharacterized protein [Clostridium sp. CAG:1193]
MKVLILSCSTGGGHNKCASYIEEELICNNIECEFKDFYKIVNNSKPDIASSLYLYSVKGNGASFKYIYKLGELYNKTNVKSPVYLVNKLHAKALKEYILDNNFSLVITTHLYPALTLTSINEKEHIIDFIHVSTDYECAPFTNEVDANYIVIPKGLKERCIEKKIDPSKLKELGIPVSTRFIKDAKNIKSNFVNNNDRLILVMLGSMGFGNVIDIIKSVCTIDNAKVVVICGNNKDLKDKLETLNINNLIPLGFVNNINDLIYSSDIVLSKPGGLSSTEISSLNKPLIHINPIPGIENYNATFFCKRGMSIICRNNDDIVSNIEKLLTDKELYNNMVLSDKKYMSEVGIEKLIDLIKSMEGKKV